MQRAVGKIGKRVKTYTSPIIALDDPSLLENDVVITDYQMPRMDGAGFVRALRERGYEGIIIGTSTTPEAENKFKDACKGVIFVEKDDALHFMNNTVPLLLSAYAYHRL